MSGRREWRERKETLTRVSSTAGGIAMALLLVYGLWQAVPDRRAVTMLERARKSLERGDYAKAEESFRKVSSIVPNSAAARQGSACALYLTGKRSAATLALTEGLEVGVFAERLGNCGHGLDLGEVFFAAKVGLSDAFAVPRVAGAKMFEEALLDEPPGQTDEEPGRMLLGACLAQRAGFAGAAWAYAGSALETGAIDAADRAQFLACFGPREQRRAGCADNPNIEACVMTPIARRAYFRDHHLVHDPPKQVLER
jgi:hypothetical protein